MVFRREGGSKALSLANLYHEEKIKFKALETLDNQKKADQIELNVLCIQSYPIIDIRITLSMP